MIDVFDEINLSNLAGAFTKGRIPIFTFEKNLRSIWEFYVFEIDGDRIHVNFSDVFSESQSICGNPVVGIEKDSVVLSVCASGERVQIENRL